MNSDNSNGFTLVEVLVSMMVVAICLTVIMNMFSGGLKSKARAKDYMTAIDLANSKMQEILNQNELEPGITEGVFENDYTWKAEVVIEEPEKEFESTMNINSGLVKYIITLEVVWMHQDNEKKYLLKTIQLLHTT